MLEEPSADVSDQDLLSFVLDVRMRNPNVGESLVPEELKSRGYRII